MPGHKQGRWDQEEDGREDARGRASGQGGHAQGGRGQAEDRGRRRRAAPLPSIREDSVESMESSPSMASMGSSESMASAELASGVPAEDDAYAGSNMGEDMPLGIDPRGAHEELGRRITEDTGAEGDLHLHAERKADEMKEEMTGETGVGGDMKLHADRKAEGMANEMFGD